MHIAVRQRNMGMIRRLLGWAAELSVQNSAGDTPVHIAAAAGYVEVGGIYRTRS